MRSSIIITVIVAAGALVLGSAACKNKSDQPSSKEGASATTHAAATAKPGSHEDWCEEHNVPESQCTRCNAKLIPAFKATGDWCEDHQLPKSHDLKCSPNLKISRPPKT